jgi:hypothetical protein
MPFLRSFGQDAEWSFGVLSEMRLLNALMRKLPELL